MGASESSSRGRDLEFKSQFVTEFDIENYGLSNIVYKHTCPLIDFASCIWKGSTLIISGG